MLVLEKDPIFDKLKPSYNFYGGKNMDEKDFKEELKSLGLVSYRQGFYDSLQCTIKGVSALKRYNGEEPFTLDEIITLLDKWLKMAKKDLNEQKKIAKWSKNEK